MKKYLISSDKPQYRANLHSHSVLSDGHLTPEEMKKAYKDEGYSILCISDHEYPKDHSDITEPDFLMLTGYEVYIRMSPDGKMHPYEPEVHLNLFAKEPHNEKYVCYDYPYAKYIRKTEGRLEGLTLVGEQGARHYDVEYINKFIKTAVDNGYMVAYNHPVWSLEDEASILAYDNCFSLEICNYGSYRSMAVEYCVALYHQLLRHGKRMFCNAGDDNHNGNKMLTGSFGAWTMIMADKLDYASVIEAMECGDMYSSTGPSIKEISFEDGTVHVECSEAAHIHMFNGGKKTKAVYAKEGEALTSVDMELDEEAPFFFVLVVDKNGGMATSRGYFRDELV
ncbi:MAG: hypothetical protein IJ011_09970 [Clostridia bacterium]|nr:hypothetical protein [Clostridia bacterium]